MRKVLFLVLIILSHHLCVANVDGLKERGDSLYRVGQFSEAISVYETLLKQKFHADVYYNLGNAYYREKDMAHALLNYERAYLLNPSNQDVRYNLSLVRNKTAGQVNRSSSFLKDWMHSVAYELNIQQWNMVAYGGLAVAIVAFLCFYFDDRVWLRKAAFGAVAVGLLIVLLGNVCREHQKYYICNRTDAIVMQTVEMKDSPEADARTIAVLHEGAKVRQKSLIKKPQMIKIALPDGKEGWIPSHAVEFI